MFDQGVPTLAPYIKDHLGLSVTATAGIVTISNLGRAVASTPAGRIVDRVGVRRILLIALTSLFCVTLAASFTKSAFLLAAMLVVGGIFTATTNPAGARHVMHEFSLHRRGIAMGIRQAGVPIGALIAALSLPAAATIMSWHASIRVLSVVAGLAVLASLRLPSKAKEKTPQELSAEPGPEYEHAGSLTLLVAWGMLMVICQYSLPTFLALYLGELQRMSALQASGLIAVAQLGGVVGRIGWGALSDRSGGRRRPFMLATTIIGAGASASLLAAEPATPTWVLLIVVLMFGVSASGWNGLWVGSLAEHAGRARSASVVGIGLSFSSLAAVGGVVTVGFIAGKTGGLRSIWLIVLALFLAAAVVVLFNGAGRVTSGDRPRNGNVTDLRC